MVSALVSGSSSPGSSPGRGHCVVSLGNTLTLTVPLSTQGWVVQSSMITENFDLSLVIFRRGFLLTLFFRPSVLSLNNLKLHKRKKSKTFLNKKNYLFRFNREKYQTMTFA